MELMIFMLMMIFGFMFFGMKQDAERYNKQLPKPKCHETDDIHDWSRHPVTGKLVCCKCDYEAGSNE